MPLACRIATPKPQSGVRGHIVAGRRLRKLPGVAQGKAQETIVTPVISAMTSGLIASPV